MDKCSYLNGLTDAGKTLFDFIKKEGFESVYDNTPSMVKNFINSYAKSSVINLVSKLSSLFSQPDFSDELRIKLGVNCSLGRHIECLYKNKKGSEVIADGVKMLELVSNGYRFSELNCDDYNDGVKVIFDKVKELPWIINSILSHKLDSLKNSLRGLKKAGLSKEISH